MDQAKKKKRDPYRNLKYLGYRLGQLPERYTLMQLVKYAKFQLAVKTRRLLKDPIWDEYTVEELLVEFYGHHFVENEDFRRRFEIEIGDVNGEIDAFSDWADKEMAKEAKIREGTLGEDKIKFSPLDVMGEDE